MADPSLQDAVVRGGDEVGKVSAPLPLSFIRGYDERRSLWGT